MLLNILEVCFQGKRQTIKRSSFQKKFSKEFLKNYLPVWLRYENESQSIYVTDIIKEYNFMPFSPTGIC